MKNFREWLGIIVVFISIIVLSFVGYKIIAVGKSVDYQFVYSSLLPLVGTWVGIVLAFYFGKENYEAARKRYENRIYELFGMRISIVYLRRMKDIEYWLRDTLILP